ncbi:unnamed protein product [Urochloa humidicola]
MKLLIDTKAKRVCFAEAGSDVFEFFSCLLCLPMSTAINLLTDERMVGSIRKTGTCLPACRTCCFPEVQNRPDGRLSAEGNKGSLEEGSMDSTSGTPFTLRGKTLNKSESLNIMRDEK